MKKHRIIGTQGQFPYGKSACFCGYSGTLIEVRRHFGRKAGEPALQDHIGRSKK